MLVVVVVLVMLEKWMSVLVESDCLEGCGVRKSEALVWVPVKCISLKLVCSLLARETNTLS